MKNKVLLLFSLFAFSFTFAQTSKTPIIEHFTNTQCAVCGYKNPPMYEVLDSYPEVIHIAYHPSSPYSNCIFSMHNPSENDERTTFYDVYGATPIAVLNGEVLPPQSPLVKEEDLNAASSEMSDFSISVTQTESGVDQMNVKVVVQKISENELDNLNLYAGLAENEIQYDAPNGEDVHHQVFRLKLGEENLTNMQVDEMIEFYYTYNFHTDWQTEEIFAYAVLQDEDKTGLQSGKSGIIGDLNGIEDQIIRDGLLNIGPSPASETLYISNASDVKFRDIRIFNIHGQLVINQNFSDVLNIETLEAGIYILQMQGINGEKIPFKFQKN